MPESTRDRRHHLTDHDLLLAIDCELPPRRQASAAAHLAGCVECRNRQAQINRAVAGFGAVYHGAPYSGQIHDDPARARLRSGLHGATVRWPGAWAERVLGGGVTAASWATIGAVATAAALVVLLINPAASDRRRIGVAFGLSAADRDALPVPSLTPGATWEVGLTELCAPAGHEQRPIPAAVRQQVLRDYSMESVPPDEYELDYLITPELGGAPHPRNLWPQRYTSPLWNAQVKDQLELLLPRMVCDRQVRLETAQRELAVDWIAAYKKYFNTAVPIRVQAPVDGRGAEEPDDDLTYPVWRTGTVPTLVSFVVRH